MVLKNTKGKIGSSFDTFLEEQGILRECEEQAIEQILAAPSLIEGCRSENQSAEGWRPGETVSSQTSPRGPSGSKAR